MHEQVFLLSPYLGTFEFCQFYEVPWLQICTYCQHDTACQVHCQEWLQDPLPWLLVQWLSPQHLWQTEVKDFYKGRLHVYNLGFIRIEFQVVLSWPFLDIKKTMFKIINQISYRSVSLLLTLWYESDSCVLSKTIMVKYKAWISKFPNTRWIFFFFFTSLWPLDQIDYTFHK